MLDCLYFKSSTSFSSSTQIPNHSQENTPTAPNVSREFNLTVQANSYSEIRSQIQGLPHSHGELHHLLNPDRECVQEALANTKNTTLTRLISTYFNHSETASELCLHLQQRVRQARAMYAPLLELFNLIDSIHIITDSHYDHTCDLLHNFHNNNDPFPDSTNLTNIRTSLTDLKQQLDNRFAKSSSRIRNIRRATTGSAVCLFSIAVGVVAATVAVTVHAILALAFAAAPICSAYTEKREFARLAQLDAAAKVAYVLNNDLDTIDRLVARLHTAVEGDKLLVRIGLERGRERYPIMEVLKQLCKSHQNFLRQLDDLEEHICLCFYTVNKARSLLLQEIRNHQTL